MSFLQRLVTFFDKHSETSENHKDERLRTRYYKTTAKNALAKVKEILGNTEGVTVTSFSEEHGEIGASFQKGQKVFLVVTVVSVRAFETAVDFSATTETKLLPFDMGLSRKVITQLYDRIDKELHYIGSGINK